MSYFPFSAAQTRLRELLEQSAGALRAVPTGRFAGNLPDGLHLQTDGLRGLAVRAEAKIVSHRPHPQTYPVTGDKRLLQLTVEVRVMRTMQVTAQTIDAVRDQARAIAQEDGDVIAQAFSWPPNLRATNAGETTGLRSLVHEDSTSAVLGTAGAAQRLETIHRFRGMALSRPAAA